MQSSSNVMHRSLELEARKPASVHQCPGWPVIMTAVAQQKTGQLLTRLTQCTIRCLSRTHEIADGLVRLIRNPDRGQFTRAVQLGEVDRVPPVSLDPVARLARDQRRRDYDTVMSRRRQFPLNTIAARARLVAKP